ncbi:uncharacterized protein LOC121757991 isoform X1 [Salvia splendens]|uniref:uncharacterized protein LOC121757991 isoform X1 n=2 Tax=Salvia splendens TaxID=180675 RepID=UPI0011014C82|nr:uncharacterized protein LOC121757991 isoform X1 [Salvia splendens]XP_042009370.1 uncharacterized protein LOC121757991 isoform X1 [Salvia splendens]
MSAEAEEVTFSLKVLVNKEKTKVLFAESDSNFVDVLLSFLTMPLGRIVKVLEKHYGTETPNIGCLNTFYNSVANLDCSCFWTEGAKKILLNPTSSFDADCTRLKLDVSDSHTEYFYSCSYCVGRFPSVSIYYDQITSCGRCQYGRMVKGSSKVNQADRKGGVFASDTTTFAITDDLRIVPNSIGIVQMANILNITDTEGAEMLNVTFGLSEIMNLFRASMVSHTPLSDLILNKTRHMNSVEVECESWTSLTHIEKDENLNSKKLILKAVVHKSTKKLLFAQVKEDFIEFLFSLLAIPLGGVECLLESKSSIKSIDNLYKSVSDLIHDEHFMSSDIKSRLIKPKLPHGYISENNILPLVEENLPDSYNGMISMFSSVNFPQGKGNYIKGPRTYQVMDDLTVVPFYISSIFCSLGQQMISVSDVEELEMEVGLEEALSILKASLTTNSALTNGLLNRISSKQPKKET